MATFVRTITTTEEAELTALVKSDDEVTRRRALCILMSKGCKTTGKIGEELALSERSVRNTITAFNKTGIHSVPRVMVSGRPRRLACVSNANIEHVIASSPRHHEIVSDYWSLESLAAVLGKNFGIENLSADTLAREMKRRGFDWLQAKREHGASRVRPTKIDAPAKQHDTPHPSAASSKQALRISQGSVHADSLLSEDERETYNTVIKNLRSEFSVCGGIEELHIQLAAVYFLRLAQAQATEDWDKAEHLDRMLKNHLTELKTVKRKQEAQIIKTTRYSQADWATEMLKMVAEADEEPDEMDEVSASDMSSDEIGALMDESYTKWKEDKESQ